MEEGKRKETSIPFSFLFLPSCLVLGWQPFTNEFSCSMGADILAVQPEYLSLCETHHGLHVIVRNRPAPVKHDKCSCAKCTLRR